MTRVCLALGLCCLATPQAAFGLGRVQGRRPPLPVASAGTPLFDKAQRMREALEGRAEAQRTRRDYDRVLDAFRAVYHANPRDPRADASVAAVAELLAEQGRLFEDRKASLDAIGEYEFLRRAYPASRHRESALLTEGEIYGRDLGDRANAHGTFANFLRLYPHSLLAAEARQELGRSQLPADAGAGARPARHRAVLDAAMASQQAQGAAGGAARGAVLPDRAPSAAVSARNALGQSVAGPVNPPAAGKTGKETRKETGKETGRDGSRDTLVERDLPSTTSAAEAQSGANDVPQPLAAPASSPAATRAGSGREPARETTLSDAALNAPPPPRRGKLPLVTGVRHWSTAVYTRVAIDLQDEVQYEASRAPNPDRIFFDLHGAKLSPELIGKAVTVTDGGYLKRIRAAQFSGDVVRVVLDVSDVSEYSAFFLPNPSRLIVDIHGNAPAAQASGGKGAGGGAVRPEGADARPLAASAAAPAGRGNSAGARAAVRDTGETASAGATRGAGSPTGRAAAAAARTSSASPLPQAARTDPLSDVATLDHEPNTVRATRQPTTAPVAASVANTTPAPQAGSSAVGGPAGGAENATSRRGRRSAPAGAADAPVGSIRAAAPTAAGERSMVRALGLKIGRIVIDAGHGGHDSGTLGPGGIEEKDVVLDVSLRLGKLLKQRLGADVIYTRDDDTFIPLETRTAIANRAQADLFLSVHANSSQDASARGVETYYLNFTSSADALEVAARENAVSDQSIHQLSDLVKKITLQDKIAESREFAGDVEQSLYAGLENGNSGLKDRGVKKAPFVVLIGANMPSVLAEISFLTNPDDARQLRDGEYRQRIAEAIYRGVARYVGSLSGVRLAQDGGRPTGQ